MILYFQVQCDCGSLFVPVAIAPPTVEAVATCPKCVAEHRVTITTVPTIVPDDLSSLDQ